MSKNTMRNLKRYENKESRLTNTRVKMIITLIAIVMVVAVALRLYNSFYVEENPTLSGLISRTTKTGDLIDPANEINVHGIDDVSWKEKGGNYIIMFGNVNIEIPKNMSPTVEAQLKHLKIEKNLDEKKNVYFTYRKQVMTKYK